MARKVTYSELIGDGPGKFFRPMTCSPPRTGRLHRGVRPGRARRVDDHPEEQIAQAHSGHDRRRAAGARGGWVAADDAADAPGMQHRSFLEIFRNLKPVCDGT